MHQTCCALAILSLFVICYQVQVAESREFEGHQASGSLIQKVQQQQRPKSGPISASFQPPTHISATRHPEQHQPTVILSHGRNYSHSFAFNQVHPNGQHQHQHQASGQRQQSRLQQAAREPARGPISQHYKQISLCSLPSHLLAQTKCRADQESEFKRTAMAEFQSKLDETSLELRHLLVSYWEEFRSSTLDLVLISKNNTLNRLQDHADLQSHHHHQHQQQQQQHYFEATSRLFDSVFAHLASYENADFEQMANGRRFQQEASGHETQQSAFVADINHELALYFRRLYLVQVKRLLDFGFVPQNHEIDFECLSANLISQQQVKQALAELSGQPSEQAGGRLKWLASEQLKLSHSIRTSIEFARTLLGSLKLTSEMFHNLTHHADRWMPQHSCQQALARMTVCPQCLSSANEESPFARFGAPKLASLAPPCEGYCLNVVRGCMNDIYELNRFWAEHVGAMERFKTSMIRSNNIENVMSDLDEKLLAFVTNLHLQYSSAPSAAAAAASTTTQASSPLNFNAGQQSESSSLSKVSERP